VRITTEPGSIWKRLGWFLGLWVAGVLSVGIVATLLRWLLRAA
jgi:hypothetical protein